MPVSKLTEHDTRAIEASIISSAPSVVETADGVTHKIWPTPTEPNRARGLEPPDPSLGNQLTRAQRPTHEGLKAALHRTKPREKTQMSPSGLCSTRLEVDRVISTFSI